MLVPRGCDAPLDLLDGLRRRTGLVREVVDPPSAMVRLAQDRFEVLILVDPQLVRQVEQLVNAVSQYHPDVRIWRYDRGRRPALRTWTQPPETPTATDEAGDAGDTALPNAQAAEDVDLEQDEPDGSAPQIEASETDPDVAEAQQPDTPVATQPPDEPAPDEADEPADSLEPPLLTDEELAMLLGDDEADSDGLSRQGES